MESIHTHNTLYKLGHTLYKKGVNQFTDLSGDEKRRFLGYGGAHLAELSKHGTVHHAGTCNTPFLFAIVSQSDVSLFVWAGALKNFRAASQLNWADEDVLTPVKNQVFVLLRTKQCISIEGAVTGPVWKLLGLCLYGSHRKLPRHTNRFAG
jgi:hypothetical protein